MQHIKDIRDFVNNVYWSLILQGLAFVALAVAIIFYPALLIALVAATFLVIGFGLLMLAWKIRKIWSKMPAILK